MTNILQRNKANNEIARNPKVLKPRSSFPFKFKRTQTMKASYLTPIFYQRVLPADTWQVTMKAFIRLNTQLVAPMDNLWLKTYFFYDPYRLLWDNLPKQHGERKNPDDHIDYITPAIKFPNGIPYKSVYDYLGGTRCGIHNTKVTAYGGLMYNHVWNEFMRDTDLQERAYFDTSDADKDPSNFPLRKAGKMRDYFVDTTKDTQAGEMVTIPIGESAPVIGNGLAIGLTDGTYNAGMNTHITTSTSQIQAYSGVYGKEVGTARSGDAISNDKALGLTTDPTKSGLEVQLNNAVAASIAAVRLAINTQEILEGDNISGSQYTVLLERRYGALNPDLRLNRPQYLGGTETPIFTTPVLQTSGTGDGSQTPQGNIAGYGVASEYSNVINASFGEFGAIMGLAVIKAIPQYQQGMDRKHQEFERFDYFYPEFQGLTDQAVTNGEIFYQGEDALDENGEEIDKKPFGYIGRYDDLRYFKNEICGEMRSEFEKSLDIWHYAEKFENLPELSDEFIQDKTDQILKRSLAIQETTENGELVDSEQFLTEFQFLGKVARPMWAKAHPMTGSARRLL